MNGYLLETNVLIQLTRPKRGASIRARMAEVGQSALMTCAVARSELIYGALHSDHPEKNLQEALQVLRPLYSLPFDDAAADQAARIKQELAAKGQLIGGFDILIAAIALANDLTLVTHNTGEFSRVQGLRIEDWQEPGPLVSA